MEAWLWTEISCLFERCWRCRHRVEEAVVEPVHADSSSFAAGGYVRVYQTPQLTRVDMHVAVRLSLSDTWAVKSQRDVMGKP
jgi:hypothetical protein